MDNYLYREEVLDHGFVELVDIMPYEIPYGAESRDIVIVNAARTSYLGESKGTELDKRLLRYLYKNKHFTPFEMVELKFRVKAPVLVWWQWTRHRTWNYNLQSGRYTEYPDEFYIPDGWRLQDSVNKQGSTEETTDTLMLYDPPYHQGYEISITKFYKNMVESCYELYQDLVDRGVAKEQARLFLPGFAMYHTGIAKTDARNLLGFISLRTDEHAQWEIRQYAKAIEKIFAEVLPWTYEVYKEING